MTKLNLYLPSKYKALVYVIYLGSIGQPQSHAQNQQHNLTNFNQIPVILMEHLTVTIPEQPKNFPLISATYLDSLCRDFAQARLGLLQICLSL